MRELTKRQEDVLLSVAYWDQRAKGLQKELNKAKANRAGYIQLALKQNITYRKISEFTNVSISIVRNAARED